MSKKENFTEVPKEPRKGGGHPAKTRDADKNKSKSNKK